jgi:hypothetical protein
MHLQRDVEGPVHPDGVRGAVGLNTTWRRRAGGLLWQLLPERTDYMDDGGYGMVLPTEAATDRGTLRMLRCS